MTLKIEPNAAWEDVFSTPAFSFSRLSTTNQLLLIIDNNELIRTKTFDEWFVLNESLYWTLFVTVDAKHSLEASLAFDPLMI